MASNNLRNCATENLERPKNIETSLSARYQRFYNKLKNKVQRMLGNKKKISALLRKAKKILERLMNLPKCGALAKSLCNFCDLLADYTEGVYKNFPVASAIMITIGVLWVVSPIDPLPDFIPFAGWTDDAAVVALIAAAAQNDINEYLNWKETYLKIDSASMIVDA